MNSRYTWSNKLTAHPQCRAFWHSHSSYATTLSICLSCAIIPANLLLFRYELCFPLPSSAVLLYQVLPHLSGATDAPLPLIPSVGRPQLKLLPTYETNTNHQLSFETRCIRPTGLLNHPICHRISELSHAMSQNSGLCPRKC